MEASAAHRLQAIPELLELLLLNLPPQRVLQYQSVCRTWKSLINTSPALLRALWYEPSATKRDDIKSKEFPCCSFNPLLTYHGFETSAGLKRRQSTSKVRSQDILDELLSHVEEPPGAIPSARYDASIEQHPFRHLFLDLAKLIDDTPGSWTSMLALQPPTRWVAVVLSSSRDPGDTMYYLIESAHANGLRLGELIAVLAECQARQGSGVDARDNRYLNHALILPLAVPAMPLQKSESYIERNEELFGRIDEAADAKVVIISEWFWNQEPVFMLKQKKAPAVNSLYCPVGSTQFRLTKRDYEPKGRPRVPLKPIGHQPHSKHGIYRAQLINSSSVRYYSWQNDTAYRP
ncbi:MAG: hypothetical protein M1821_000141 [Bathelium mastoideum]|nr:MAG: hypothetical protein M1821_000141 [Bathelium mastoideum]KAI9687827.1 MAG: hypothetical protein M1822_001907 [Bathelium mastoideum]